MMWILLSLVSLVVSIDAYAQRRGGFAGHAPPLGKSVSINPAPREHPRPPIPQIIVPYAVPYPVYTEGGYSADNPQAEAANGIAPYPYPPQPPNAPIAPAREQIFSPTTIDPYMAGLRQGAEGPARNASAPTCPPDPARNSDPAQFFIALKDHWVYTAIVYWVESGTLHYVTSRGSHNQVSLDLVDRRLSQNLNAGRRAEFVLPPE